jgi:ligand-binding SRPBCC domain-containing protein
MLPPSFNTHIRSLGNFTYELSASQVLPVLREQAFSFFEEPRNLFDITPDWLRFVMKDRDAKTAVAEHAEFDYTIRWLGMTMFWRSRIVDHRPPERFTDVQIAGPYRAWSHLHVFEAIGGGTRMKDTVIYRLPFGFAGTVAHALLVRRQLRDIFQYRALRIDAWARGAPVRKRPSAPPGRPAEGTGLDRR